MKTTTKIRTQLDSFIRNLMGEKAIPGVSIGIIQEGKTFYTQGYGYRDLENGLPMTPDTLLGIGSITKSFTAFAIVKLIEENKLALDDSVSTILKREPFLAHPDIQIGHLLSHSSGLPSTDASLVEACFKYGKFDKIFPVASEDDLFHHMAAVESHILHKPDEIYLYNNDMYECLGLIVERVTKMSFTQYIQECLFSPLRMDRATFSKEAILQDSFSNYMIPYLNEGEGSKGELKRTEFPIYEFSKASGGIFASITDMLKYIELMLNGGSIGEKKLISDRNFSLLWKPRIAEPDGFTPNAMYALGWVVDENYMDQTMIYHGGHIDISCASIILIPSKKIGIMVGQNSCNCSPSIIGRYAAALLLGKTPEAVIPELRFKNIVESISGTYFSPLKLYELTITVRDQILWANIEYDDGVIKAPMILENETDLLFSLGLAQPPPYPKIKFSMNTRKDEVEFAQHDRYIYKKRS